MRWLASLNALSTGRYSGLPGLPAGRAPCSHAGTHCSKSRLKATTARPSPVSASVCEQNRDGETSRPMARDEPG